MRQIVLDTETTGLSPNDGDRLVEIGCLEIINQVATGETFHRYINPERDMPKGAFDVHGLSEEFLRDKPKFAEVADAFLEFIGDDPLVRSEEHTSELQSLMRISYAVFCLKKK